MAKAIGSTDQVLAVLLGLCVAGAIGCSGRSDKNPTAPSQASSSSPTYDIDALGVPRFAANDYIDLAMIQRISRFRSSIGHDWHDDFESCRSMKHYFEPRAAVDWSTVSVYAPVQGTVDRTLTESTGLQVAIRSTAYPAFTFIVFHLNPALSLTPGTALASGQRLGAHIGSQTMSDIGVGVSTPRGYKLVSWFEVMADSVFQGYAARGVVSRESAIISRAERDADPLSCNGETFASFGTGAIGNWLTLR